MWCQELERGFDLQETQGELVIALFDKKHTLTHEIMFADAQEAREFVKITRERAKEFLQSQKESILSRAFSLFKVNKDSNDKNCVKKGSSTDQPPIKKKKAPPPAPPKRKNNATHDAPSETTWTSDQPPPLPPRPNISLEEVLRSEQKVPPPPPPRIS